MKTLPRALTYIIITGFLIRLILAGYLVVRFGEEKLFTSDSYNFYRTGINLVQGRGFSMDPEAPYTPEAHFPPLYPLAVAGSLAISHSILALIFVQIVLSSLLPVIVWKISGFLTDSSKTRLLAAGLTAFEPMMIVWSVLLLTEVVSAFLFTLAVDFFFAFLQGRRIAQAAASGSALGLATLTRPNAQFIFILAAVFLIGTIIFSLLKKNRGWQKTLVALGIFTACFVVILAPWLIRNQIRFHSASVASTGLRNLYTSFPPSVLALRTGRPHGEIQGELNDAFTRKYGITPEDIQKNPRYGTLLAKEGLAILKQYPADTAKVLGIALGAFFTQELYLDYLQRFSFIPRLNIDFSPSVVLVQQGPLALTQLVWQKTHLYLLIPLLGRILWVSTDILALIGTLLAIRAGGKKRTVALILATLILYYATTSSIAAFSDHGRFRYPVNSLLFILAGFGIEKILTKRQNPIFSL